MTTNVNLQNLQISAVSLTKDWMKLVKADLVTRAKTSSFFTEGLTTLGVKMGKDKAGNDVTTTYGLKEFMVGIYSGDAKLIPDAIQAVLDATRSDKVKEGEAVTNEGIIKNNWSSMLSTLQKAKAADKVKADEIATIKASLIRLLDSREEDTVAMLAEVGFADDRSENEMEQAS